ncbi:MAG: tetratricopeptide repeat protein, partial [Verrucomicrobiota bacterium]
MNRFLAIASFLAPLSLAPSLEAQNLLERIRNPNADAIASAGEVASQQQAGDSLFAKAEEYAASGRQRQANDLYRQIVKKYPRSQGAAEAQYRIAEALDQSGDGRKAYDAYRELVTSYPNTRHFEIAVQRQFAITENLQQARKKGFLGFGQGTQSSKLIEMYGQIADLAPF